MEPMMTNAFAQVAIRNAATVMVDSGNGLIGVRADPARNVLYHIASGQTIAFDRIDYQAHIKPGQEIVGRLDHGEQVSHGCIAFVTDGARQTVTDEQLTGLTDRQRSHMIAAINDMIVADGQPLHVCGYERDRNDNFVALFQAGGGKPPVAGLIACGKSLLARLGALRPARRTSGPQDRLKI